MARLPRLYAPGIPQLAQARLARPLALAHQPVPAAALTLIQQWLIEEARRQHLALHGWAILLDRIVLLATPPEPRSLSVTMQGLGRHMAASMVHGRVFHDRYRSALVEHNWVPAALVWAESLPATQGLVDTPLRWPWSSAKEHTGQAPGTGLLTDHPAYWALGNTPFSRQTQYQALLQSTLPPEHRRRIEQALQGQWALGDAEFLTRIALHSSRRATPASRGRPRKKTDSNTVTN